MQTLLEIKNLKTVFSTARGVIKAVDGVSLILNTGETLGIVGESGSGKTTVALSIMGLLPENTAVSGEILYRDHIISSLPKSKINKFK